MNTANEFKTNFTTIEYNSRLVWIKQQAQEGAIGQAQKEKPNSIHKSSNLIFCSLCQKHRLNGINWLNEASNFAFRISCLKRKVYDLLGWSRGTCHIAFLWSSGNRRYIVCVRVFDCLCVNIPKRQSDTCLLFYITFAIFIIFFAISMSPWWFCPISAMMKHGWFPPIIRPGHSSNSNGILLVEKKASTTSESNKDN